MTKIVQTVDGNYARVRMPKPVWEGRVQPDNEISNGVFATGFYAAPKTDKYYIRIYSQWDNGNGGNRGERYHEVSKDEYTRYMACIGLAN